MNKQERLAELHSIRTTLDKVAKNYCTTPEERKTVKDISLRLFTEQILPLAQELTADLVMKTKELVESSTTSPAYNLLTSVCHQAPFGLTETSGLTLQRQLVTISDGARRHLLQRIARNTKAMTLARTLPGRNTMPPPPISERATECLPMSSRMSF